MVGAQLLSLAMTSKPEVPMKRKAIIDEELQRRQVQRSWRRRGGLESLPNMPLDVLMEVRGCIALVYTCSERHLRV